MLLVALVSLYLFLPQLSDMFAKAAELGGVQWRWFLLMFLLEAGAFVAFWELVRIAVPGVSWFVAATSHLTANALGKVIPGGQMIAGAAYYGMLSVSGVPAGRAAAGLAATSALSTLVLLALPGVSLVLAGLSAPVPRGLLPVAIVGTVLFVFMFLAVVVLVRFDRPLHASGFLVERGVGWVAARLRRPWKVTAESFVHRRDEVVGALGRRWERALGVAVLNWMLDYLALVVALVAIGAEPRPSLVLLAFAAAAVLGMIPLTPGGLGFVEAGLVGTLTLAGIPSSQALLATLAYRLFQFWTPIPAGAVAYFLFRHRYGRIPEVPSRP